MVVIIEKSILLASVSIKTVPYQESRQILKVVLDLMYMKMLFEYKKF